MLVLTLTFVFVWQSFLPSFRTDDDSAPLSIHHLGFECPLTTLMAPGEDADLAVLADLVLIV